MMKKTERDTLINLYQQVSKHSNYQILPTALQKLIKTSDIKVKSRYEKERMDFIKTSISFKNKRVLDIGGNTGYFSFESIDSGAREVVYVEGNREHAYFVENATEELDYMIKVENKYFDFNEKEKNKFDIVLLLNVLHHYGDDYGSKDVSLNKAKEKIKESINFFCGRTNYLVLQLGFCWKGNIKLPLFENGTKIEMIKFIKDSTNDKWKIDRIGIPTKTKESFEYILPDKKNLKRNDDFGEFLNRPIFILRSKN